VNCPFCDSAAIVLRSDLHDVVKVGRRSASVDRLQQSECHACGATFVTPEQHDANLALINAAKAPLSPISPREIRETRVRLRLTQEEAQKIFGGGPKAFSKYETGRVIPSDAFAKLLRLAAKNQHAFEQLAADAGVSTSTSRVTSSTTAVSIFASHWHTFEATASGQWSSRGFSRFLKALREHVADADFNLANCQETTREFAMSPETAGPDFVANQEPLH
jgi:HTH-type transcriptional regulator/antitoxin MqsA